MTDAPHSDSQTTQGEHLSPGQDQAVTFELDSKPVTSPVRRQTGLGIRKLGDPNRVDGFETQKLNPQGKKERTIRDDEEVELNEKDRFRTVPNEGGPGAGA